MIICIQTKEIKTIKKNWVIHKFPKVQDSYHNTGFSDETESISVLKHSELQYFVVCVEVLRPSQPQWGHVECGQFT